MFSKNIRILIVFVYWLLLIDSKKSFITSIILTLKKSCCFVKIWNKSFDCCFSTFLFWANFSWLCWFMKFMTIVHFYSKICCQNQSRKSCWMKMNLNKLWIVFAVDHKKLSAVKRFETKYCREILKMSIKASADNRIMSAVMKIALRNVYVIDYSMSHIMHFDIATISWCKKLTFYDFQSEHRITFVMKNFVEIRKAEKTQLDFLFVHELNGFRRLFVIIFKFQIIDKRNEILNFFFWRF